MRRAPRGASPFPGHPAGTLKAGLSGPAQTQSHREIHTLLMDLWMGEKMDRTGNGSGGEEGRG
jgi:hypothetical protein